MRYNDAMATKKKQKKRLGWHFLPANMKLGYSDNRKAEVGKTLSVLDSGKIECCYNGMHASEKISQAASYGKGPVLCRVEVSGDIETKGNKFAGRNRKILWARKLTTKEMKALLNSVGYYYDGSIDEDSLVQSMDWAAGSHADEMDVWLGKWAKDHGCIPSKYTSTAPAYVKPDVTEKLIISLLSNRMVRTQKEIVEALGEAFNNDNLQAIFDDIEYHKDVAVVDNYTENGDDGYVLKLKRKR